MNQNKKQKMMMLVLGMTAAAVAHGAKLTSGNQMPAYPQGVTQKNLAQRSRAQAIEVLDAKAGVAAVKPENVVWG